MVRENYKAWEIDANDFPSSQPIEEQLKFLLRYAILAPSALNTQPWKFEIFKNIVVVKEDKSRYLRFADPKKRNLLISIGCCITNLIEAAKGFSFSTEIKINSSLESDICAEICFTRQQVINTKDSLIRFITKRFSDKGFYDKDRPINKQLMKSLNSLHSTYSKIHFFDQQKTKKKIIDLSVKADKTLLSDLNFRKETSSWIRPNFTKSNLGIPGFTFGLSMIQSTLIPIITKFDFFAKIHSEIDRKYLNSSPYLGLITIRKQDKLNWIDSGMLYERFCLLATREGLSVTPLSAIIELDKTNKELREFLNLSSYPTIFFRMGYSTNRIVHTPRLPLN